MSEGLDETPTRRAPPVPLSRYVAFSVITVAGLVADLVSKAVVFSWPSDFPGEVLYWWWEGHAGIQRSLNEGALFGLGYGAVPLFAAISIGAAIAIPAWLFYGRVAHDWWLTAALGSVMSGVLGNLYDRLGLSGEVWPAYDPRAGETVYAVRDWILWRASEQWTWPNFNLADVFLVTGAAVLMLRAFFEKDEASEVAGSEAVDGPSATA